MVGLDCNSDNQQSATVHSDVRLNISSTFQERQLLKDILKKIKN